MPDKKKSVKTKPVNKKLEPMELCFIVYSNPIDEEIVEIIHNHGVGFTKFSGVQGEGNKEPHHGTSVWPGINNCVMVVCDRPTRRTLAEEILDLKNSFAGIGISFFVTDMKESL